MTGLNVLTGTPENYDGQTDITSTETTGGSQTGVVYGRAHAWSDRDFIYDFNSGANPMASIAAQTSKFWAKQKQSRLVGILNGIFGITDDESDNWDAWQLHTLDIKTGTSSVAEANKVDGASAADAMQKANGDNAGVYSMAIMHSRVAFNLEKQQLLQFRRYTDAMGIERTINIADWNGLTVIVDDGVPVGANSSASGEKDYTTYLFGTGALLTAPAPVKHAVELDRDPKKYGGRDFLYNRLRETIHPNGFSWTKDMASTTSPTDSDLSTAANWKIVADAKLIPMARIISNG